MTSSTTRAFMAKKQSTSFAQVATNLLNVLQGYTKTIRLLLVMFLTLTVSAEVWGYTGTFEKITSTSQLTTGYYIIVASADAKAVGNTVDSNKRIAGVDVTISNNNITNPDDAIVYYIAKSGDNYTFNNVGNGEYLYQASTTKGKGMGFTSESKNITCAGYNANSPEGFKFTLNGGSNNYFKWNKSSNWFANYSDDYTTSMTPVRLFKLTSSGTIPVTGVSLDKSTLTLTEGDSETLTATVAPANATDKTITWSTSNSSVATVSDGKVTAVAEGSATITVTTTDGGKTATCDVTVNPKPKYTVTLNAGSGTCEASVTETSAGAGVDLLTPTICDGWTFAGWATSAVATETSSKPATLLTGTYKPTSNITLYAVYQRTETIQGGGSGNYELVTSAPSDWSGTYLIVDGSSKNCFNGSLTTLTLDAGGNYATITISDNTITSTTTTDSYAVTISKSTTNGKYYIKTASGYYIGSDATDSSKSNELDASISTKYDNSISISSNNVTIQGPDHILKFFYQTGQSWRFRFYKSTTTQNVRLPQLYKKSSGSSSTTYYHSTPDCGITEPSYSVTWDPNGGNWNGNTDSQVDFYEENESIFEPEAPIRNGYTFNRWDPEPADKMGTENLTYTAQWTAKTIIITWNQNYTGCPEATTSEYTYDGEEIAMPENPSRTGYKFNGWFTASSGGTQITDVGNTNKPADNTTYYAQWTEKTAPNISWSALTCTVTIASPSNELPTLNNPNSLSPIVYSSSATDVATIDDQGRIILKSEGKTTITAAFAETEDYKSAAVTYTLTVVESDNCRWIETDIEDIEYGDEVVVAMETTTGTYALNSSGGTTSAPPATSVTVTNKEITSSIQEALMWSIEKDGNNLIFHPITEPNKNLYCNTAEKDNDRVRVGSLSNATINHKFIISENHLQNSITNHYLGIYYSNGNAQDWRGYASSTQFAGQTLKFYKRVCLSEGQYWVKWMVAGQEYTAGDPTTFTDEQITAIPTDPDDDAIGNCANKFMGWSETNIGSTPDDANLPTIYTSLSEIQTAYPSITGDKTFYAVFATASSGGGAEIGTVVFSEDFSSFDAEDKMTGTLSSGNGRSIYGDGSVTYSYQNGEGAGTKIYEENNADGTSPELLVGKKSSTFTISGIPSAGAAKLQLSYKQNAQSLTSNVSGIGYSGGMNSSTKQTTTTIITVGSEPTFNLTFTGPSGDKNVRLDDISIIVYETSISYSNYVTQCCTDWTPTLTYSKTTLDSESSETATPTITGNTHNAPVSFESSNASVLEVDTDDGTITAKGAGKATITATWAATGEYCEKSITTDEITVNGNFLVTFYANDGSGNTTTQQIPSNTATALNANTFQRDGYTFQGWATSARGAKEYDDKQEVTLSTSGLDLYAVWQVKTYNITIGTITGNGTITTSPTNSANYDAQVTITATPAAHYTFASVTVTRDDNSQTVVVGDNKFTMPASDVTITAVFTENEKFAINYAIPTGGGTLTDNAPTTIYIDGSITLPGIKDGTISSEYSCEEFIGWTTEEPNGEGLWDGTPTIYASGTNSEAITANTTFYAVYQRSGGGASGSVQLTNTKIATREYDDDESSITEEDGSVWGIKCYVGNSSGSLFMQLKDGSYYIKTPTVAGNITSLTINYTAVSSDSRTIYFNTEASKDGAVTHQFNAPSVDPSSGNHDYTWDVSAANTKTGYILASSTFKINSIKLDYGPAPIISHSLQCGCAIDEFDLTYDANETNFPNSTTNCEGVIGYKFSEHEDKYTICSSVPTLDGYKFIGWTTNANGSGDLYTSGQEIKCVPSSDITLYAQYERVYTVIFDNQNTINATTQTRSGAAVDVPTATEPCGSEWQFVGWSTEEIAPMSLKPTITIEPGINTYIPEGDITLYAIYQKTSQSKEFVAGKTGAYKISNGNDKYASTFYSSYLQSVNNLADATTYYITYTASDGGKYTIQQADGLYIAYSGESTSLEKSEEPYYWKITKDGELWQVATIPAGRYLKYSTEFRAYQDAGNMGLIATEGQYYYRTMSCDDNFDITFNNQNGAIIHWQNGYPQAAYQDLEGGTTITTFPTASYEGWTFIGWRALEYEESTSAPESSSVYGGLDGISGNALTITANVTMYPVFTQFLDNDPFDEVNGGDYYMYYIADGDIETSVDEYGAANRIYAGGWESGGVSESYGATQSCAEATLFTFTKLSNGKWTIYDNNKGKYLCADATDNNLALNATTATNGEWTITVHNGNQVNAVSKDGYTLSAQSQNATSGTFKNYATSNFNDNSEYYHRIYVGSCTERVFTTAPSTEPIITLNGDVKVTSTATQSVKAASVLTVSASNIATSNLSITSDNAAFIVSPTTITVVDKKVGVTPITITYKPTITSDGTETATITVSDGNETSESITVTGRHLPTDFVIAAKWGDNWYTMPADMNSQSSTEGWLIEVDDAANPTKAIAAPNTTKYGLKSVYTSNSSADRFANYGERLVFVENVEESTPVANKTLYNGGDASGSKTNIQVYAQYANYYSDQNQAPRYEWIPMTTDLTDYTLTSGAILTGDAVGRTVSLDNHGIFGTLLQDKSYNGMVRLLPVDNFYDPAELQVVEWKQNSVSVMYTGAGTKYTTKVGNNAESDVQALTSIDHAVYSLSTTDLTAATNQPLIITIKDDADATIGAIKLIIPAIVATDKSSTALGVTAEIAKATSVVVLDGATLTADVTKYTYDDIVVYPGGKLVINDGKKLGMYTLTLRAGSSWGAAEYEHKYPQFVLNAPTDAYSNSSGKINLDYVTTKEQYYTFVAPFDVKTKDIKYPFDIYGSNVAAANKGSFEFQYYDGAARAEGNTGWKVVEEDPTNGATLTAGQGYTFLGMPKKINGTRQKYGIHRISMTVAAGTAMAHENSVQSITVAPHPSTKNNNSGWNLIGNPYMSTIGGLTNEDIQVGKLVHTNDANGNWTGGWHWDEETVQSEQRFLVIPSNDGQSYEAVQASNATLHAFKNFFVQISNEGANALSIPRTTPAAQLLAPARRTEEVVKDVEVAIVLEQDEAHTDQMDFLINNIYTEDFERDADFTKMMNATNLNLYGVHPYDNLSFVAIDNNTARGSVAIGYQVPQAGEYTLRMSDKPYVMWDKIEALYVTDHEMSPEITTDIMSEPYRFTVANAETNHTRFTVSITLKANTEDDVTTILENVDVGKDKPYKFFYQDKLYILRNGIIYDAMGKQVQTINK